MTNKEKGLKQITFDQLKEIMLDSIQHFPKIIKNVLCRNCSVTEITDYTIYLGESGFVLLEGACKNCGKPVARVLETDEDPRKVKIAKRIYKNG